ncbi:hypothetical protein Taro_007811 [Colocasia esculenta]|uniref:F-box domain-containing protein n=1 Tax=Colocasia esculenta TaxID=4460 RepID=A0A843U526_COLES|nr:hypothetical protein [Colocasia esculenta]
MAEGGDGGGGRKTHLYDLPEAILVNVFAMVEETRSRNAMALVCRRWRALERATRTALTLRGNVHNLFLVPTCFRSVGRLDLSLLSPWGSSFLLPPHPEHAEGGGAAHPGEEGQNNGANQLIAHRLRQAFPSVTSLIVYARSPCIVRVLVPQWAALRHVKLVRWHQRPFSAPLGSDVAAVLQSCSALSSLDLSNFYCWPEDLPPALQGNPNAAAALTRLDLLGLCSGQGFKSQELLAITAACPNLVCLRASCVFDPRFIDFVGDDALLGLATNCPRLSQLHIVDAAALSNPEEDGATPEDARISHRALEDFFAGLPLLEDLALDIRQNVRDTGPVLETMNNRCPKIELLTLGHFQGVCRAAGLHLDGIAVCGRLKALTIKNADDLTDAGLVSIARGCSRLSRFEIQGCQMITEVGLKRLASIRRSTLVDVRISSCGRLNAARSLWAMEPIRDRIERLHIDCAWTASGSEELPEDLEEEDEDEDELDPGLEFYQEPSGENGCGDERRKNKKIRGATAVGHVNGGAPSSDDLYDDGGFWCRTWRRLRHLSLWVPVGEPLTPLAETGLENCPRLEEICIKVEGDCRKCAKPNQCIFGLNALARYPELSKMKLDLGDAIGYALTAPMGQMDLSVWERIYLGGIDTLTLQELDYWPPQDKDVNQRSLSLPAAAQLAQCSTLRKLFIHGTTHEHFMGFFLAIPNLRDVQLREDYYPAPESDTSTEMRVASCRRFEAALNQRPIPD